MARTWCIPGSPLADGSGWRIWYAQSGSLKLKPERVRVGRAGQAVDVIQKALPLKSPPGFDGQMMMAEVRLAKPDPGRLFNVTIPELDRSFDWQTMPTAVGADGVSFVFASCFWWNDDKEGFYRSAVEDLMRREQPRPAFKLLIGDQIYLDFPIPLAIWREPERMVRDVYQQYWGDDAYRDCLLTSPNFFCCDDHEYWNDFPEKQNHLPHTWSSEMRENYGRAADAYYQAFQNGLNPRGDRQRWIQFEMSPASFFIADTRSRRTHFGESEGQHFLDEPQWDALKKWQHNLTGPGILVLGQPLFQKDGDWKDKSLSNFRTDYATLLDLIEKSLRGENEDNKPHDILVLSGDIHTARHAAASMRGLPGKQVHEFIASPASRVAPYKRPKPSIPPSRISAFLWGRPHGAEIEWAVRTQEPHIFTSTDNNVGLVRLFPAEKHPYRLRVQFCSYLVRPYQGTVWRFLTGGASVRSVARGNRRLYETEILLR